MAILGTQRPTPSAGLFAILTTPAIIVFLSSNFVNAGNLFFNVLFSRWLGPELFGDLALLLTIKLSVLGVMGAIQMAVSQNVADAPEKISSALARINFLAFCALWMALPVVLFVLFFGDVGRLLGLENQATLLILSASLPFAAPLSILRGYAFGRQMTGKIVLTANVEMAVRLIGAIVAWKSGFGIEGVTIAIALSIVAGWLVLADLLPLFDYRHPQMKPMLRTIGYAAFPFAVLQLSQVICLDGEIFLASALLAPKDAGYIAALSLFQRIEFFACFALASVLLPSVIKAAGNKQKVMKAATPVGALYLCVAAPFMIAVWLAPDTLIRLLVGPEFLEASSGLMLAAFSATAFTLSYLLATMLIALNDRRGVWLIAYTAVFQITAMSIAALSLEPDFETLLLIKAAFQAALLVRLALFSAWRLTSPAVPHGWYFPS